MRNSPTNVLTYKKKQHTLTANRPARVLDWYISVDNEQRRQAMERTRSRRLGVSPIAHITFSGIIRPWQTAFPIRKSRLIAILNATMT